MKLFYISIVIFFFLPDYLLSTLAQNQSPPLSQQNLGTSQTLTSPESNNKKSNQTELAPCQLCRYTCRSFINTYKIIGRKMVQEGVAVWSEDTLIYNENKTDLMKIIKKTICDDITVAKLQCRNFFNLQEDLFEFWLKNLQNQQKNLITYICIDKMKICCPDGHFGPTCRRCPGAPNNVCSKNGHCKGAGTKKGSGRCDCFTGYTGDFCDQCKKGFFNARNISSNEPARVSCVACDKSCRTSCTDKGPKNCDACKNGYFFDEEYGCLDINECLEKKNPCKKGTFCVNTEGNYLCYECDKACDGCHGDGPDMCHKCQKGFKLENNVCLNIQPSKPEEKLEMSRYATYVGLCLATCIIFADNMIIASTIGFCVALYIGLAEYTVGGNSYDTLSTFFKNFVR